MNPLVFQFHKGTIRTLSPQKAYHSIGLFQFHKGTIRTGGAVGTLHDLQRISIP